MQFHNSNFQILSKINKTIAKINICLFAYIVDVPHKIVILECVFGPFSLISFSYMLAEKDWLCMECYLEILRKTMIHFLITSIASSSNFQNLFQQEIEIHNNYQLVIKIQVIRKILQCLNEQSDKYLLYVNNMIYLFPNKSNCFRKL